MSEPRVKDSRYHCAGVSFNYGLGLDLCASGTRVQLIAIEFAILEDMSDRISGEANTSDENKFPLDGVVLGSRRTQSALRRLCVRGSIDGFSKIARASLLIYDCLSPPRSLSPAIKKTYVTAPTGHFSLTVSHIDSSTGHRSAT